MVVADPEWSSLRPARFRRELAEDLARVFELIRTGALRAHVAGRFPIEQAGAALRALESGGVRGKIVLVPGFVPASAAGA